MGDLLDGVGALVAVVIGFLVLGALYGLVVALPLVVFDAVRGETWAQLVVLGVAGAGWWGWRLRQQRR